MVRIWVALYMAPSFMLSPGCILSTEVQEPGVIEDYPSPATIALISVPKRLACFLDIHSVSLISSECKLPKRGQFFLGTHSGSDKFSLGFGRWLSVLHKILPNHV